jgi:hypothetical protein
VEECITGECGLCYAWKNVSRVGAAEFITTEQVRRIAGVTPEFQAVSVLLRGIDDDESYVVLLGGGRG